MHPFLLARLGMIFMVGFLQRFVTISHMTPSVRVPLTVPTQTRQLPCPWLPTDHWGEQSVADAL